MAIRKLKPIEDRDPYAAAVLDAYDKLESVGCEMKQPIKKRYSNESQGLSGWFVLAVHWGKWINKHARSQWGRRERA